MTPTTAPAAAIREIIILIYLVALFLTVATLWTTYIGLSVWVWLRRRKL
jgi:hypothetical protein